MTDRAFIERASAVAAAAVGSRPAELWSNIRLPEHVGARWAVMLAIKMRDPSLSSWRIGRMLKRDPRGVAYSLRMGEARRRSQPGFAKLCERVAAA